MPGMNEHNSVQQPLVEELVRLGWTYVPGKELDREHEQVFVESEVAAALARLNPDVADEPSRASEIVKQLRNLTFSVDDDGLVETNKDATGWLRGLHAHKFVGTDSFRPVRLIDFEDLSNNRFMVSDEVGYGAPGAKARFDIVLFVNGLPLVVGETKTAFRQKVSWLTAANEVVEHYEAKYAPFFTTNVFSFATEGRELMYGATGAPVEHWMTAGPAKEHPLLADVLEPARWLLAPASVLKLLSSYTLFETPDDNSGVASLRKLIARYMQFDAVELMIARAHAGQSRRGLIYHTQGSGKTLAMVFAAGQLLQDPALANPTIVFVADRIELVRNAWDQFRTTNMPRLLAPSTARQLHEMLGHQDRRGLVFTTVHKFAGAAADLNTRSNVVVLVDEAHRTQEGNLGLTMRAALPNALFFAFTGTPIAELDRNTFATFGDDEDPKRTLHAYTSDQSIADGMTVPIHVDPRLVTFQLDKAAVDEAFEELKVAENLDDDQAEVLARRGSRVDVIFANPSRIDAVCTDIVDHFYSTVDPLGEKAQIVVYDRAACVAYKARLAELLSLRHAAGKPLDEAAVVMSVTGGKDEDEAWSVHRRTESEEAELLRRFRTHGDPLKFLVVTARLGTGFNAPIEGALYLDKPMKDHTLFQTITRTNRTWRNPSTGQEKRYGLIVDYVGLGSGFARAMAPANGDQDPRSIEVDGLIDQFEAELVATMRWFAGIDHTLIGSTTLLEAQQRIAKDADREAFVTSFLMLEGIWEACAPHLRLAPHQSAYRFLAKIYASIAPIGPRADLVWQRLGTKTLDIVFEHMTDVKVTHTDAVVVADADTIHRLEEEGLLPGIEDVEHKTAAEVLDTIYARLKKRLQGPNGNHPIYRSLAERLEDLRARTIADAQQSIDWLRDAFSVARDLRAAEKAEDEAGVDGLDLLPDPNVFALTQILRECAPPDTPVLIERVVAEVDAIVKEVTAGNSGWASTQKGDRAVRREVRNTLRTYGLHTVPGLFERAYAYIAEHY
ncbi:MAG: HsdR family type I site-specific deoxyribonuclease [Propionicimonas sp.]|uniref:type I restriction endonuclease subunit R n=1 Tax=Propionicimonas sp. TaxID=1955623 RepID=UPI003D0C5E32